MCSALVARSRTGDRCTAAWQWTTPCLRWGDERGPTYTDDSYSRSTEQTLTDLDAGPDQTTSRLVMPLLRALGVTRARQVGQTTALKLGSRPTPVTVGDMVSGLWTTSPPRGGSSVISWISQSFRRPAGSPPDTSSGTTPRFEADPSHPVGCGRTHQAQCKSELPSRIGVPEWLICLDGDPWCRNGLWPTVFE
jgi:hypothetical protein